MVGKNLVKIVILVVSNRHGSLALMEIVLKKRVEVHTGELRVVCSLAPN